MTNHQDGIRMSAVKHDDAHSLRVNRTLMPGEVAPRNFWCTCGHQFGEIFDSTARSTYRKHRKTSVSEPCEECDGHGEVRVWSLADVVGFLQPCQACDGHGQVTNA